MSLERSEMTYLQRHAEERARMVEEQIHTRGVTDPRVLDAMRRVCRHLFVPSDVRAQAYEDHPLPIGHRQTISQPYMVGLMTQELAPQPEDVILEVGTGSGYQTAILSLLAREVISIERNEALADEARARLARLGYGNITVVCGDGTLGYPGRAPYDGILVTAGGPEAPRSLKEQLTVGGRLICPVGPRNGQKLRKTLRQEDGFVEAEGTGCVFVPLVGAEGWPEE